MSQAQFGLVLTGGGARGAYQAGVLKALAEIASSAGHEQSFKIISGMSAGAINAAFWAATSDDIVSGTRRLAETWSELEFGNVLNASPFGMASVGMRLVFDVSSAPLHGAHLAHALLDTAPLKKLLTDRIKFSRIAENLEHGHIRAFSVTATDYATATSTTFMEAAPDIETWERQLRRSVRDRIRVEHVLASSAIPIFFPPTLVDGRHYGDGCLRNNTPLSPAIHMGANKLFVIGVRKHPYSSEAMDPKVAPSLGRIFSVVLNAIMIDGLESDLERLHRINRTLSLIDESQRVQSSLKPIDVLTIHPTEDLSVIASAHTKRLPRTMRFLIKGLGPIEEAASLVSYILFDRKFCGELVQLGYEDTRRQRDTIESFLGVAPIS